MSTATDIRADCAIVPNVVVVVAEQGKAPLRVELGIAPLVIGSDPECDAVLDDGLVSRRHAELVRTARGVLVRDRGSKNGTSIDRVAIHEAILGVGQILLVGTTRLRLELTSGSTTVPLSRAPRLGEAIGASVAMRALFAQIERVARTSETVLFYGESGTGKELLARAVHDLSPRSGGPFVVFDCGAVPPTLAEAELFGFVRGAFTGAVESRAGVFEQATGGTLFIDELGELPLELQPKLLRAIESRQVRRIGAPAWTSIDIRLVAATNRNLRAEVSAQRFRADLLYRVAVIEATVPPLRERRDDIEPLVRHFLAQHQPPGSTDDLPPGALAMLRSYDWPGNVRELRNTVARLLLLDARSELDRLMMPAETPGSDATTVMTMPYREARDLMSERFERHYLETRLAEFHGNVSRTAAAIGLSRQFLHKLLERHSIRRADPGA